MSPKVGEYSYYDITQNKPCYLVNTEHFQELVCCHYSLPYRKTEPFLTCLGKITSVSKKPLNLLKLL